MHRLCTFTPFHVEVDIRVWPVNVFEELQWETPSNQTIAKTQLAAKCDWIIEKPRKSFVNVPQGLVAEDHLANTLAGLRKPNDGSHVEGLVQAVPDGHILRGSKELEQYTWLGLRHGFVLAFLGG